MLWAAWLSTWMAYLGLIAYLTYGYWYSRSPRLWVVTALGGIIMLAQGILLHHWIDMTSLQNLSLINMFATITWVSLGLITLTNLWRPVASLLLVVAPVGLVLTLLGWFDDGMVLVNTQASATLFWHIVAAILTVATFTAAVLQAIFMYLHHYLLKNKHHLRWLRFFPSLETQGQLLLGFIILGFILLTWLMVNGIILWFSQPFLGSYLIPKLGLALIAWLLFLCLLLNECLQTRQSLRLAQGTLLGFVILCLSYLGTYFVSL